MEPLDGLCFVYMMSMEAIKYAIVSVERSATGLDASERYALEVLKNQWRTEIEVLHSNIEVLLYVDLHTALSEYQSAVNAYECGEFGRASSLFERARQLAVSASHTVQGFALKSLCTRLRLLCIICGSFEHTSDCQRHFAALEWAQGSAVPTMGTSSTLLYLRKECVGCVHGLLSESNVRARLLEELGAWAAELLQRQRQMTDGGAGTTGTKKGSRSVFAVFSSLRKSVLRAAAGTGRGTGSNAGSGVDPGSPPGVHAKAALVDGIGAVASAFAVIAELSELNALMYRRLGVRVPFAVTPLNSHAAVPVELFHAEICGRQAMSVLCPGYDGSCEHPNKGKSSSRSRGSASPPGRSIEVRVVHHVVVFAADGGGGGGFASLLIAATSQRCVTVYRLLGPPSVACPSSDAGVLFSSAPMDSIVNCMVSLPWPKLMGCTGRGASGRSCALLVVCGCVNGSVCLFSAHAVAQEILGGAQPDLTLEFVPQVAVQAHGMNKPLRALSVYTVPHTGDQVILTAAADNVLKVWQFASDPGTGIGLVPATTSVCAQLPCMARTAGATTAASASISGTLSTTLVVHVGAARTSLLDLLCVAATGDGCSDNAIFLHVLGRGQSQTQQAGKPGKPGSRPLQLPARSLKPVASPAITATQSDPALTAVTLRSTFPALVGDGHPVTCLQAVSLPTVGRQLLCSCSYGSTICVFDLHLATTSTATSTSTSFSNCLLRCEGHTGTIFACVSLQGLLFTGDDGGFIHVWNLTEYLPQAAEGGGGVGTGSGLGLVMDRSSLSGLVQQPSDTIACSAAVTALATNGSNLLFVGSCTVGAYFV